MSDQEQQTKPDGGASVSTARLERTTPPATTEQAYAMAQVCLDLHAALGVDWGGNPYLAISRLKQDADRYRWLKGRAYKDGATLSLEVAVIYDIAIGDFGEFIDATADDGVRSNEPS